MSKHRRKWWRVWTGIASAPYTPIAAYLSAISWAKVFENQRFLPTAGLARHLPVWLAVCWILAIALGGMCAVLGVTVQRNRIEASGLVFLLTGAIFYGIGSSYELGSWETVPVSVAIALMCAIRLRVLAVARKAQEGAARIVAEE